jgi:hypothetical protein
MAFKKGTSGNLKGRPRGAANVASREIKQLARDFLLDPKYRKNMEKRILSGDATALEIQLHFYGFGRPKYEIQTEEVLTPHQQKSRAIADFLGNLKAKATTPEGKAALKDSLDALFAGLMAEKDAEATDAGGQGV